MTNFPAPTRRLFLGVGLALAAFFALMAVTAAPHASAACTSCEEEDVYTTSCVPFLVPNSSDTSGFTTTAANPDIPEIEGVPCTGHDSGACIGLAEEQEAMGPQPVPRSTISSSP